MRARDGSRSRTLGLAAALLATYSASGAPHAPARMAAAPSTDSQIASANDRLRTSSARLRAAARSVQAQPGSAAARNELKLAAGETEASYEYLIGMFSKQMSNDHRQHLEQLQKQLQELQARKRNLVKKVSSGGTSDEWHAIARFFA